MAARKPTKKMLPEFEFRVNVRYDQEFRSRDANQRLRKAHPKVKKIHVGHRDTAKQSRDGNSYIKVTIAAPSKAIAKACFDDGNSRVLKRQSNNNRRRRTNKRGTNKRGTNKRGTNRRTRTNKRATTKRKTPPKPRAKTPSPENTRPTLVFPEEVTLETNWGEYMERCDEYKKKHPEFRVIC